MVTVVLQTPLQCVNNSEGLGVQIYYERNFIPQAAISGKTTSRV